MNKGAKVFLRCNSSSSSSISEGAARLPSPMHVPSSLCSSSKHPETTRTRTHSQRERERASIDPSGHFPPSLLSAAAVSSSHSVAAAAGCSNTAACLCSCIDFIEPCGSILRSAVGLCDFALHTRQHFGSKELRTTTTMYDCSCVV